MLFPKMKNTQLSQLIDITKKEVVYLNKRNVYYDLILTLQQKINEMELPELPDNLNELSVAEQGNKILEVNMCHAKYLAYKDIIKELEQLQQKAARKLNEINKTHEAFNKRQG